MWKQQAGGLVTAYVYDASGEMAAEYTIEGQEPAEPCTTCYLMTDALGSTRMVTDGTASMGLHDYLPFGQELQTGMDGRNGNWDGVEPRMKFTGRSLWRPPLRDPPGLGALSEAATPSRVHRRDS